MESAPRVESRLRYYIYCFYIGGVPLFNMKTSIFYNIFILFCAMCAYSMLLGSSVAIYKNRKDLDNVMIVSAIFLVFLSGSFTQSYFR
jgi:hypothetical protein